MEVVVPAMSDIELGKMWRQLAFEWKNKLFDLYDMDTSDPNFDWDALTRFVENVTQYYCGYVDRVNVMELDVHDLWDELMLLAKVTPAHLPQQEKIVNVVLFARKQGIIYRWRNGKEEEAITSEGTRMWIDLPFLVNDMKMAWFRSQSELDQILRHNLAAFTARLCALGICENNLAFCAIWLLRKALEMPRRVTRPYYRLRRSVVELLPACVAWFQFSGYKLLTLATSNLSYVNSVYFTEDDVKLTAPGELALKAGVVQWGFSHSRWLFWKNRFNELTRFDDGEVATMAKFGYDAMVRAEERMAYENANKGSEEVVDRVDPELLERMKRAMMCGEKVDSGVELDWVD